MGVGFSQFTWGDYTPLMDTKVGSHVDNGSHSQSKKSTTSL